MSFPQITNNANSFSSHAAIIQNAPICQLPVDLFFTVLKFLDPRTVDHLCSLTCKQFKIILSDPFCDRIWRDLFYLHFPNAEINNNKNFRLSYKDEAFIISNIKNIVYSSHKILGHHHIARFSIDDKGRIFTVCGCCIKICDAITRECINTINISPNNIGPIWALTASNGRLYAGLDRGEIEIFDSTTGLSLNTLRTSHICSMSSLTIIGNDLIAIYRDRHIEIFNVKEIETPGI